MSSSSSSSPSRRPLPKGNPSSSSTSTSTYFAYPVAATVSGILRRLSSDPSSSGKHSTSRASSKSSSPSRRTMPHKSSTHLPTAAAALLYTPPQRHLSPFQPPPLTPLTLTGWAPTTKRLLSASLAEEMRLLLPPRNQLLESWTLAYSLDQHGSSLSTLYTRAAECREGNRSASGFVLAVRDARGSVFGAYLSDAPAPAKGFYGNGECFLWRASVLPKMTAGLRPAGWKAGATEDLLEGLSLPPLPSEDTTHAQRTTTLSAKGVGGGDGGGGGGVGEGDEADRIRFKAFPYSGENDYMIFCEAEYLSVGGGDGHYGLWLDDGLAKGVSSTCPTFGNEPLSDEGTKFEVLGVELWYMG